MSLDLIKVHFTIQISNSEDSCELFTSLDLNVISPPVSMTLGIYSDFLNVLSVI